MLGGEEMQTLLDMLYKNETLLWLICGLVAGAGWWRFRTISWAIFGVLLLLKSVTCLMINWPVQVLTADQVTITHGFFTQGAMSDPEHNMWKLQTLGIIDGLIPILLVLGFVARWLEETRLPIGSPGLTRKGQPRLPHHPACGSAPGGSVQTRAFGP